MLTANEEGGAVRLSSIDSRLEKAIIHASLKAERPEIAKRLYKFRESNIYFGSKAEYYHSPDFPERADSKQSTRSSLVARSESVTSCNSIYSRLDQSPTDLSKHISMIRNMSMSKNLKGVYDFV